MSYLAILPLPASDLGRDVEIEIAAGIPGKAEPTGAMVAPALTISLFNLRREQPIAPRSLDLRAITTRTYGGLVLEMGDAQQHGSFEAFARHIDAATLKAEWNEGKRQLDVAYRSGDDLLEAGFTTDFSQSNIDHFPIDPGAQERAIPYRRLNGAWPYLPAGLERDTSWAQQGTTGRLEKAGAVLVTEPGRKAYLIADPLMDRRGAVVGYNPLPDLAGLQPHRARRRHVPGRRQGRTAACGIPALGEGLRHQPCAETRAGRRRREILHNLGTCRAAARDPEWASRRCPGRRTGLPDLLGMT